MQNYVNPAIELIVNAPKKIKTIKNKLFVSDNSLIRFEPLIFK